MNFSVSDEALRQLGEAIKAAAGPGDDVLAEGFERLVGQAVAHRSMVPVRRIFFCSCSTP